MILVLLLLLANVTNSVANNGKTASRTPARSRFFNNYRSTGSGSSLTSSPMSSSYASSSSPAASSLYSPSSPMKRKQSSSNYPPQVSSPLRSSSFDYDRGLNGLGIANHRLSSGDSSSPRGKMRKTQKHWSELFTSSSGSESSTYSTGSRKRAKRQSENQNDIISRMKPISYNTEKKRMTAPTENLKSALPDLREINPSFVKLQKKFACESSNGCKFSRSNNGPLKNSILVTPGKQIFLISDVVLGAGKFGITKLAQNAKTGDWVVLKVSPLPLGAKETKARRETFDTEKMVLSKLDGRLVDSMEINNKGYIITPFIEGLPVTKLPWNAKNPDGTYIMKEAAIQKIKDNVILEAKALQEKGFVHGDLHADNILANLKTGKVNLIDFGIVHKKNLVSNFAMMERSTTLPFDIALQKRKLNKDVNLDSMFERD